MDLRQGQRRRRMRRERLGQRIRRRNSGGGGGGGGGGESDFDGGFGRGVVLLFEMDIRVAFGAEVHGRWAAEEATVVDAEPVALRGFASMLFRHILKFRILEIGSDL